MSIPIDTYHGTMCEAIKTLRSSFLLLAHAEKKSDDDLTKHQLLEDAGMQCRYAFLLAANSLEAAANALILGLQTSQALYNDLEKLPTLLKFEVVCMAEGKRLDRGHHSYALINEIVQCRNEFVHPKPRIASYESDGDAKTEGVGVSRTKSRGYLKTLEFVTPEDARTAIGDILAFLGWVIFDTCQLGIEDGSKRLGCGSIIATGDAVLFAEEFGYDARTFGRVKAERDVR